MTAVRPGGAVWASASRHVRRRESARLPPRRECGCRRRRAEPLSAVRGPGRHHGEASPALRGHRLADHQDAPEELQGRCQVHQRAERGQRDAAGRSPVEQQRQGRDGACGHEQRDVTGAVTGQGADPGDLQHDQQRRGGEAEHDALGGQTGRRRQRHRLLDQPVRAERDGQREAEPRHVAAADTDQDDRGGCDTQRDPLQQPGSLAKHEYAEDDVHQRADVVAQRDLDDVPDRDAVDEQAPVGGDQHCRGRHHRPAARPQRPQLPPAAEEREDRRHEDQRPDDPVGEDLDRRCRVEQRPERREQPPDDVRTDAAGHAAAVEFGRRRHNLIRSSLRDPCRGESPHRSRRLATANVATRDGKSADSRRQKCRLATANVPTRGASGAGAGGQGDGVGGVGGVGEGSGGARHDVRRQG